jgi:hypothetical protein
MLKNTGILGNPNAGKSPPLFPSRLLKNAYLLRFSHPSSLRRTSKYASLLRISGALHPGIFEQSAENNFFSKLLVRLSRYSMIPSIQLAKMRAR